MSNGKKGCDQTQTGMEESKIEFKWLEAKCTGSDTVVFRLEDGALVKVKIDIDRAGVAVNFANPDGSPNYNVTVSTKINVVPANKAFSIPKSQLGFAPPKIPARPPIVS